MNIVGEDCPKCQKSKLQYAGPFYPFNEEHLLCPYCREQFSIEYKQMHTEDINNLASDMMDVAIEELYLRKISLNTDRENKLFDDIVSLLRDFGSGDYKSHH